MIFIINIKKLLIIKGEIEMKKEINKNNSRNKKLNRIEINKNLDKLPQNEPIFKEQYEKAKEILKRLEENGELKKNFKLKK